MHDSLPPSIHQAFSRILSSTRTYTHTHIYIHRNHHSPAYISTYIPTYLSISKHACIIITALICLFVCLFIPGLTKESDHLSLPDLRYTYFAYYMHNWEIPLVRLLFFFFWGGVGAVDVDVDVGLVVDLIWSDLLVVCLFRFRAVLCCAVLAGFVFEQGRKEERKEGGSVSIISCGGWVDVLLPVADLHFWLGLVRLVWLVDWCGVVGVVNSLYCNTGGGR